MSEDSTAHHQTIVALDIAGHDTAAGSPTHRLLVHEGFWKLVRASFAAAGVPWDVLLQENRADSAMIHLPTRAAEANLVAELAVRMLAELRQYNEVHAQANVRLRVAFHTGEVRQGNRGTVSDATGYAFRLVAAPETKNALERSGAALALIVSDPFYRNVLRTDPATDARFYHRIDVSVNETKAEAWLRLLGAVTGEFPVREWPPPVSGQAFSELVEALLAVPCVRKAESRRLLLELFTRREIADIVPYHAEDRLHVIALARTCRRFAGGLAELLDAIRIVEPESPQVTALAAIIDEW